jgi:hypothetical protein
VSSSQPLVFILIGSIGGSVFLIAATAGISPGLILSAISLISVIVFLVKRRNRNRNSYTAINE